MTLRARYLCLIAGASAAVILAYLVLVQRPMQAALIASESERVQVYADAVAAQVSGDVTGALRELEHLAGDMRLRKLDLAGARIALSRALAGTPYFRAFSLLDTHGTVLVRPDKPHREGADRAKRDYFRAALDRGQSVLGDVFVTSSGHRTLVSSTPVHSPDGEVVGILAGHLGLMDRNPQLYRSIVRPRIPERWEAFLLGRDGTMLAHSEGRLAPGGDGREVSTLHPLLAPDEEPGQGLLRYSHAGRVWHGAAAEAGVGGWLIGVQVPETVVLARSHELANRLSVLFAAAVGILLAGSLLLARHFAGPARQLTRALTNYGKDGRFEPIRVQADGEMDEALGAFNRMVEERQRAEQALRDSEHNFRTLLESSVQGILIHGYDWLPLYVNRAYARLFGFERPEEILTLDSISALIAPEDRERLAAYREARRQGLPAPMTYEFQALRRDGNRVFVQNVVTRVQWQGRPAIQTTLIDVTARRHAEAALQRNTERLEIVASTVSDVIFEWDLRAGRVDSNDGVVSVLGYRREAVGTTPDWWSERLHPDDRERVLREQRALIARAGSDWSSEFRFRRADGSHADIALRARLVHGDAGRARLMIGGMTDVSEARRLSARLAHQATHDALTGLVNRSEFEARLHAALGKGGTQHALGYLDLDQFKVVNDTCGHAAGDELLRQLGELLPPMLRSGDTIARLGGDEFGVLMLDCTAEVAHLRAQALLNAIGSFRFVWEDKVFNLGVSIGLVSIREAGSDASELLRIVDAACYVAKEQGRNRVHMHRAGDEETARREGEMQWVSRIHRALEEDQFCLYAQPIVPVHGGEAHHVELLVRMREGDGTLRSPGAFLPAAERYNLATRIDWWVIDHALDWFETHAARLHGLGMMAINLSGHSVGDRALLDFILGRLRDGAVAPERLCFELTETAAISRLSEARRMLSVLRDQGCRFALDDFGAGLSSFAYLRNLPVDFLKIDGSFVREIAHDPANAALVRSANEVGHAMGKRTIAEFVENAQVLSRLREIGVDFAQGYHLGRPEPIDRLLVRAARGKAVA